VVTLIAVVRLCFGLEILFSRPDLLPMVKDSLSRQRMPSDWGMLYVAIGIWRNRKPPQSLLALGNFADAQLQALTSPESAKR